MSHDDREFRIRPGRPRSTPAPRSGSFVNQVLRAARKAGPVRKSGSAGESSSSGRSVRTGHSTFGRGRAGFGRSRLFSPQRRVVVKARVVRHRGRSFRSAPMTAHLAYLQREGVRRDDSGGLMFHARSDDADDPACAERCQDDRHHFRFIVSPDDAVDMTDLRGFTRDLVSRMEQDLGTGLDWVAINHWNTSHPHVHLLVRGVRDNGENLVIARDYIKEGMRDRARDLVTLELGPRSEIDIRASLSRQLDAERWTALDRQLVRDAARGGIIDLAPHPDRQPDAYANFKVTRLRKLETFGLAEQLGPGQWVLTENAQAVLREMGLLGDIIKRIHRGLSERGIERGSASYVLAGESLDDPVLGRLSERGLDDELKGTA